MNTYQYSSILSIEDVMDILKIGRNKCYDLLNSGELKGFRIGTRTWKIPRESIDAYINDRIQKK